MLKVGRVSSKFLSYTLFHFILFSTISCSITNTQPQGLAFKASSFHQLSTSSDSFANRFDWPETGEFHDTFTTSIKASPYVVIRGDIVLLETSDPSNKLEFNSWYDLKHKLSNLDGDKSIQITECKNTSYVFSYKDKVWEGFPVDNSSCYLNLTDVESLPADVANPALLKKEDNIVIGFKPNKIWHSSANISPRLWDAWTYSSTLMKLDKPLYDLPEKPKWSSSDKVRKQYFLEEKYASDKLKESIESNSENTIDKIRNALNSPVLPADYIMNQAAVFAEQAGDLDLAISVRSRFQPMGRCSMDTWPQEAARDYAELCFNNGDLACFLNLQVKIMAQNFQRVAYSSYGEKVHNTEAERLRSIGIDVSKFLKGLIHQFSVPPENDRQSISTWRLARSIVEADMEEDFYPYLREIALDDTIDEYNRLRAVQVWSFASFYKQNQNRDNDSDTFDMIISEFESEALSELSRSWFNNQFVSSDQDHAG